MWHIRKIVQKVRKQKMNEMLEVVIKIPKDTFDAIGILQDFVDNKHQIDGYQIKGNSTIGTMIKAIANGTILPKNHGRLIDADKIKYFESSLVPHIYSDIVVRKEFIDAMPTILDAEVGNNK